MESENNCAGRKYERLPNPSSGGTTLRPTKDSITPLQQICRSCYQLGHTFYSFVCLLMLQLERKALTISQGV